MKIALVHEHLGQDGGAERVLRVLQTIFPQAPTYTLVYHHDRAHQDFRGTDIRTSFIQRLPGGASHYQWYLALMGAAIESFDLSSYDVVLSNHSAFAKGVLTLPRTLHLSYCHSPTRYLWSDTHQYVKDLPYPRWIKKLIPLYLTRLRLWDRLAADRVDQFMSNSRTVQQRVQKYYQRDSIILHPPVDTERFSPGTGRGGYYVTGGRLVSYKRFDIAIQAFNRLGIPLKIYGVGPSMKSLQAMAKPNIEFLGKVPDAEMNKLYQDAIAFLNPQEEDFGITAVEAMAAGRPVIAYAAGGALETVQPGVTGTFFAHQEWEALADAVIRFKPEQFDSATIRAWSENFSIAQFTKNLRAILDEAWAKHQKLYS